MAKEYDTLLPAWRVHQIEYELDIEEQGAQTKTVWWWARQTFNWMILIGSIGWIIWLCTRQGQIWRWTTLTTIDSDPSRYPGILAAPQHLQPLHTLEWIAFPIAIAFILVLSSTAYGRKGWTIGKTVLMLNLVLLVVVMPLIVHSVI